MITLEHVETDITSVCNNCCVGCDHYSPYLPPRFVPPEEIERDLANAARLFHAREYSLLGGEPTLHPQLLEIIDIAHASGIADSVQVITNGQTLHKMPEVFWQKLDSLWITQYFGKVSQEDVNWAREKCRENGKEFVLKVRSTLSKTFSRGTASSGEAQGRFERCHLKHCNILDNGYLYLCCAAPFVAPLIMGLPEGTDGLKLEGATEANLKDYLDRRSAFEGCKRCVEVLGIQYPWRETTREKWYQESEC